MAPLPFSRLLASRGSRGSRRESTETPASETHSFAESPTGGCGPRRTSLSSEVSVDLRDFESALSAVEEPPFESPPGSKLSSQSVSTDAKKHSSSRCIVSQAPSSSEAHNQFLRKRNVESSDCVACPAPSSSTAKRADGITGDDPGLACSASRGSARLRKSRSMEIEHSIAITCVQRAASLSFTTAASGAARAPCTTAPLKSRVVTHATSPLASSRIGKGAEIRFDEERAENNVLETYRRASLAVCPPGSCGPTAELPEDPGVTKRNSKDAVSGGSRNFMCMVISPPTSPRIPEVKPPAGGQTGNPALHAGLSVIACAVADSSRHNDGQTQSDVAKPAEAGAAALQTTTAVGLALSGSSLISDGPVKTGNSDDCTRCATVQESLSSANATSLAERGGVVPCLPISTSCVSASSLESSRAFSPSIPLSARRAPPILAIASPRQRPSSCFPFRAAGGGNKDAPSSCTPAPVVVTLDETYLRQEEATRSFQTESEGRGDLAHVSSEDEGNDAAHSVSSIVIFECDDSVGSPSSQRSPASPCFAGAVSPQHSLAFCAGHPEESKTPSAESAPPEDEEGTGVEAELDAGHEDAEVEQPTVVAHIEVKESGGVFNDEVCSQASDTLEASTSGGSRSEASHGCETDGTGCDAPLSVGVTAPGNAPDFAGEESIASSQECDTPGDGMHDGSAALSAASRCPECSLHLRPQELEDHLFAHALDALQARAARRQRGTKSLNLVETCDSSQRGTLLLRTSVPQTETSRNARAASRNLLPCLRSTRQAVGSNARQPSSPQANSSRPATAAEGEAARSPNPDAEAPDTSSEAAESQRSVSQETVVQPASVGTARPMRKRKKVGISVTEDGAETRDESRATSGDGSGASSAGTLSRTLRTPRYRLLDRSQSRQSSAASSSSVAAASRTTTARGTAGMAPTQGIGVKQTRATTAGAATLRRTASQTVRPTSGTQRGTSDTSASGSTSGRATHRYMEATAASLSRRAAMRTASRFVPPDDGETAQSSSLANVSLSEQPSVSAQAPSVELETLSATRRVLSERGVDQAVETPSGVRPTSGSGTVSESRSSTMSRSRTTGLFGSTSGRAISENRRMSGALTARPALSGVDATERGPQTTIHRSTLSYGTDEDLPRSDSSRVPSRSSHATGVSGLTSRATMGSYSFARVSRGSLEQRRAACAAAAARRAAAGALETENVPSSDGRFGATFSEGPASARGDREQEARPTPVRSSLRSSSFQSLPVSSVVSRRSTGVIGTQGRGVTIATDSGARRVMTLGDCQNNSGSTIATAGRSCGGRPLPPVPLLPLSSLSQRLGASSTARIHSRTSAEEERARRERLACTHRDRSSVGLAGVSTAPPSSDASDTDDRWSRAASARDSRVSRTTSVQEIRPQVLHSARSSAGSTCYGVPARSNTASFIRHGETLSGESRRTLGARRESLASRYSVASGRVFSSAEISSSGWVPTWGQTLIDMGLVPPPGTNRSVSVQRATGRHRDASREGVSEESSFGATGSVGTAHAMISHAFPRSNSVSLQRSGSTSWAASVQGSSASAAGRSSEDLNDFRYRLHTGFHSFGSHGSGRVSQEHSRGDSPIALPSLVSRSTTGEVYRQRVSMSRSQIGAWPYLASAEDSDNHATGRSRQSAHAGGRDRSSSDARHHAEDRWHAARSASTAAPADSRYTRSEWTRLGYAGGYYRDEGGSWSQQTAGVSTHRHHSNRQQEDLDIQAVEASYQRMEQEEDERRSRVLQILIDLLPTSAFDQSRSANLSDEAKRCSICFEDYEHADELRRLPCTHVFHKNCIDVWLRRSFVCPICKHDLRSSFE
ncbi:zinc finger, C3HC4 type (RING finger) domain-containing protein [Toxoplasma gondii VAND]|uniref:Zinc finger, C3HC4 type (RING finger) domain-containing protein n=1 Tax=Toxoplasma gondii VAND TaxID=933077 RepID=A0A086PNP4_TOXGO|nr:zinc finger, C3HC4 type (RING finger) domain-containing protein [Toxoplasma gondii VAND]